MTDSSSTENTAPESTSASPFVIVREESDPPPETEEPEITYWDQADVEVLQWENEDEAIENILDGGATDGELEICGYTRRKIKGLTKDAEYIAEKLIDYWDEEYGSDQDYTEPTQEMIALAYDFVRKMAKRYKVWRCEIVCRKKINVKQWVETHRPDWLTTTDNENTRRSVEGILGTPSLVRADALLCNTDWRPIETAPVCESGCHWIRVIRPCRMGPPEAIVYFSKQEDLDAVIYDKSYLGWMPCDYRLHTGRSAIDAT